METFPGHSMMLALFLFLPFRNQIAQKSKDAIIIYLQCIELFIKCWLNNNNDSKGI